MFATLEYAIQIEQLTESELSYRMPEDIAARIVPVSLQYEKLTENGILRTLEGIPQFAEQLSKTMMLEADLEAARVTLCAIDAFHLGRSGADYLFLCKAVELLSKGFPPPLIDRYQKEGQKALPPIQMRYLDLASGSIMIEGEDVDGEDPVYNRVKFFRGLHSHIESEAEMFAGLLPLVTSEAQSTADTAANTEYGAPPVRWDAPGNEYLLKGLMKPTKPPKRPSLKKDSQTDMLLLRSAKEHYLNGIIEHDTPPPIHQAAQHACRELMVKDHNLEAAIKRISRKLPLKIRARGLDI